MVCFQGGLFSRQISKWRELTLSFESALQRITKVKVSHRYGKCKYAELNFKLCYFIRTSCSALNMEEERQKMLPHVSNKSCSDPVFLTKSQAAMNYNFGAPASVSSRAKYRRIAQSHINILTDYLMIPWLQAEDQESLDWDLVLPLILGYTALGGSLAVNSVVKVFLT